MNDQVLDDQLELQKLCTEKGFSLEDQPDDVTEMCGINIIKKIWQNITQTNMYHMLFHSYRNKSHPSHVFPVNYALFFRLSLGNSIV